MAILQLKAARAWNLEQAAQAFLVTADTIRWWLKRVDEQGPDALVQLREPVNRFPDFVRYLVQQLKALCPMLGKTTAPARRNAQTGRIKELGSPGSPCFGR
jgi:hypothetical protein